VNPFPATLSPSWPENFKGSRLSPSFERVIVGNLAGWKGSLLQQDSSNRPYRVKKVDLIIGFRMADRWKSESEVLERIPVAMRRVPGRL
jgi:hypothetical protein